MSRYSALEKSAGFQFAVGFFSQFIWDAHHGVPDAKQAVFGPDLVRYLEAFEFDGEAAKRFRQCFTRWSKALRRETAWLSPRWEAWMAQSLKQEVNRVLEIVEQIDALTASSRRYLLELVSGGGAQESAPRTVRPRLARTPRRLVPDRTGMGMVTEDLEESVGVQTPRVNGRTCGCAPKGKHRATCAGPAGA